MLSTFLLLYFRFGSIISTKMINGAIMDKQWYVYILQCKDNTLYTGITDDVERRVAAHNAGKGAKYTRGRGPTKVIYTEPFVNKPMALRREFQIKQMSREEKLTLCNWEE